MKNERILTELNKILDELEMLREKACLIERRVEDLLKVFKADLTRQEGN